MAIEFNTEFYLQSKFNQLEEAGRLEEFGLTDVASLAAFFEENGVDAQEHYLNAGMAEGINPSAEFDTTAYLEAKLAELKDTAKYGDTYAEYTVEDVIAAFKTANLTPLQHFNTYGESEGLTAEPAEEAGETSGLTAALGQYQAAVADQAEALTDLNEFVEESDDLSGTYEATVESADAAIEEAEGVLEAAEDARDDFVETTVAQANNVSDGDLNGAVSKYLGSTATLTEANLQTALAEAQDAIDEDDALYTESGADITDGIELGAASESLIYEIQVWDGNDSELETLYVTSADASVVAAAGDGQEYTVQLTEAPANDAELSFTLEGETYVASYDATADSGDGDFTLDSALPTDYTFAWDDATDAATVTGPDGEAFELTEVALTAAGTAEVQYAAITQYLDSPELAAGYAADADITSNELDAASDLQSFVTIAGLQENLATAEADLASARNSKADANLLTELRTAISSYADAGGDLSLEADTDNSDAISQLLVDINDALSADADDAVEVFIRDEFGAAYSADQLESELAGTDAATAEGQGEWTEGDDAEYVPTAAEQQLINALAAVETRSDKINDLEDATNAFDTDLGAEYNLIEQAIEDLADLEQDVVDANELVTEVTTLADALKDAIDGVEGAEQTLSEEFGVEDLVELGDSAEAGTADAGDVYLFTEDTANIELTNFEAEDRLFIGTEFSEVRLADDADLATERLGSASELEVFIQQDGANTVLSFEAEGDTFAGSDLSTDGLTQVTLEGVNAADLELVDGFVQFAATETVEIA